MSFSASLVNALWQSVMDLFLCRFRLVSVLVVYLTGMALKAGVLETQHFNETFLHG